MNKFDPQNHHRRSIRLREYDYSQDGLYFITICTQNREHFFGYIDNGTMQLYPAGEMIEQIWLKMPDKYLQLELYEYIVMPNHFHAIFGLITETQEDDIKNKRPTVGTIVGAFKSITTREYIIGMNTLGWQKWDSKLWQRNFYEHIIRTPAAFNKITDYIINNPLKWDEDENNIEENTNSIEGTRKGCPYTMRVKNIHYYPLLTVSAKPDAIILANGEFPTHTLSLHFLRNSSFIVCCDGAANEFIDRGYTPDAIVGDGDSLSPQNQKRFADIIFTDNDQETNDQTKAVNYCLQQEKKDIIILGATGKREDHTLGNISLLMDYMEFANVVMVTDYGVFMPVKDSGQFECFSGQQISIINFGATGLKGENLVYPLSDFTNWWQGTLNEATADNFIIHAEGKYLLFRAFP